jgi:phosphate:Na+ symporter
MWENFDLIKLIGGLGMFIFGMFLMEEAIKKLSGASLKKVIKKYTSNVFKSILTGFVATTALQSSSALSLIVLAFVGAGVMNMQSAIGLILGANIGSTTTGWIVALLGFKFNIETIALPIIGIGGLFSVIFTKKPTLGNSFQVLAGMGLLFLGLSFMKTSVEDFANSIDISSVPNYGIWIYFILGIAVTAIMQASSATVAIVLTALNAKLIGFSAAAAMVIGADVGTTITILLGAIGGSAVKKRVAFAQVGFNLFTGIAALIILPLIIWLISFLINVKSDPIQALVIFHTTFNVLGVLIFIPFIKYFTELLIKTIEEKKHNLAIFINKESGTITDTALLALKNEIFHLFNRVLFYNISTLKIDTKSIFRNGNFITKNSIELPNDLMKQYESIKHLQAEIIIFAAGIQMREISIQELEELEQMMHGLRMAVHSAKTIKDIAHNFEEFESEDNEFMNEQYANFRKRLIETYLIIYNLMEASSDMDKVSTILNELGIIKKADKGFLKTAVEAINDKKIQDISLSNIIVANRSFVQSSRQILLALREIILSKTELERFDKMHEDKDEFLEIEDN